MKTLLPPFLYLTALSLSGHCDELMDRIQKKSRTPIVNDPLFEKIRQNQQAQASQTEGDLWTTYSTKGHAKADGLDITLKAPKSWTVKEGDRPHIVQKFTSVQDGYTFSVMLMIRGQKDENGAHYSTQEILASLEDDKLKKRTS